MKSFLKSFLLALIAFPFTSAFAFEQKQCMRGIDTAMNSSISLGDSYMQMSKTMMSLLNSGIDVDDATVKHLLSATEMTDAALSSAGVISTLRQLGSYKQTESVDKLVNLQFQNFYKNVKYARSQYTRFTGALKNQSLREQAFDISQKLESISRLISACEK